jgi:hypothetical protein
VELARAARVYRESLFSRGNTQMVFLVIHRMIGLRLKDTGFSPPLEKYTSASSVASERSERNRFEQAQVDQPILMA